ncbi:glutamate synthase (NADPH/NADH) large chain [Lebetimonas natsushimae]|uniref:glutamate synthase (NADPH) n=1 Tax=Lebetimonas natsushimae TaxID=1936991 RepID=A0A292YEU5_9BACT|nr:glutamate synthase large subunit [Lebetimonas natsushimae]GAX87640.1 glutamate synthase (NADPH/NADH) large chain [Lebetimonas natsushimae]
MSGLEFKDNCGFGVIANIKGKASHSLVNDALKALERMMHRGAIAADGKSGDGSGLLFSMPKKFFRKVAKEKGIDLPENFGIGVIFLKNENQKATVEEFCEKNDLKVVLWREVPVNTEALGEFALNTLPKIYHAFIVPNSIIAIKRFEELLYLTRKEIENFIDDKDFYIPTFSSKKVAYKGLLMPNHLKEFYPDLADKDFEVYFALFHQRFSTNTLPEWRLAQPFRFIAHNGEINSIQANRINSLIKTESIKSEVFTKEELERLLPIVRFDESDSSSLDRMIEFLIMNGMDFFKAVRSLIPMPWQNAPYLDSELKAFYEYFSTRFEAWDGPAAVSVSDGRYIAVVLDRNGLRPAKYAITKDDRILIASEYGVLDLDDNEIVERGRLQSGQMIGVDTKFGVVLKNKDIDEYLKSSNPYTKWLNENMIYLQEYIENPYSIDENIKLNDLIYKQRYAGITKETINLMIKPMMKDAKEPTGSMGDDTPLACFSDYPFRSFNDFFRQKFAQVTNPPIDSLREKIVMSLNTGFGEIHNILDEAPEHARRIKTTSPILTQTKLKVLKSFGDEESPRFEKDYKNKTYSTVFKENLKESLEKLTDEIVEDVRGGIRIIFLDDRNLDKDHKLIPMSMVIGRLHKKLIDNKLRHLTSIVAITGEVTNPHDAAVLIAYGASAIYPYLLFKTVVQIAEEENINRETALFNVHSALNKGILKIMSKMGISTIASYRNSALMDIIGLSKEVTDECFIGSKALLPGLTYEDIEERINIRHEKTFESDKLDNGGVIKYRRNSETHEITPEVVKTFKKMLSGDKKDYEEFKKLVENRRPTYIRDFLDIKSDRKPISIDEVESAESIVKRFVGAAMSIGALSPEAHEIIAQAMNELGAKSNSGEGGEDPVRNKTIKRSKIRQVASGRFGVTPEYLVNAEEIQIKVAQGAKPGEGGQLPGFKVTTYIAKLRHTTPGKTLISPPPHHDIYSIEDLAQLIFDLKQINPTATISVKLVSTAGVGTIAAGVAKAYADQIVISGSEGGTGAAPVTSIRHAGNPWELGLIEAHNALKENHLREFVALETDGALKVGRDVIFGALFGAEYYAFGTSLLMAVDCIFCRSCQTNKCPVGITTQDPEYREKFRGNVDKVKKYMLNVAEDVREYLAKMGYKSLDEIIGRNDLITVKDIPQAKKFDFSALVRHVEGVNTKQKENVPFDKNEFEKEILNKVMETIKNPNHKSVVKANIINLNRSFGARISGMIAKYYGDAGLADDSIIIELEGVAGQSFGVFLSKGVTLKLKGVANDYVGKGMAGGKIIITPKKEGAAAGNTCLYGATAGKLFIAGVVGERFAVRNSGAVAIVEGTGDHPCEYMTGGEVIILGETGINFGAGMTGGVAFVYDKKHNFVDKINPELIEIRRIDIDENEKPKLYLKKRLIEYYNATGSKKAKFILDNFRSEVRHFWLVTPKDNRPPLDPNDMD